VVKEQAPKSAVSTTKSSEQKKSDTADFLDELFCDPSTISKAKPISNSDSSGKANVKETPKHTVSDSKPSSAVAEPSAPSQPTLDSASILPPTHDIMKDEDTVKSKVMKEDSESSEKVGSTNKRRRLPDWLTDAASHVAAGASSTSGSKAPASRKRKTPSSTGASSTAKRAKAASPADESKDDDTTLPSPPPTKKVRL
jgi:hypothetical protein